MSTFTFKHDYVAADEPYLDQLRQPDPSSYANADIAHVTHFHLDLHTNFKSKTLSGSATFRVKAVITGAKVVVFDVKDLSIPLDKITVARVSKIDNKAGAPISTKAWISRPNGALGQALTVTLPDGLVRGDMVEVVVPYATSPNASAIQWLSPEQTAGKKYPYLFTQCQAIHARSLLPCQDTPSIKAPYTATITVPSPLQALMSAVISDDLPEKKYSNDSTGSSSSSSSSDDSQETLTYSFTQKVPIPSYLVALAVGKLEKRDVGPRSAVWSEPEMVERGAYEFAETERFIQVAESICGDYVWGRYDILLMPPSFPYGGMENPCLTFVTPTLLAGDRSLANVVAHEIAHSWMGNLVTNKTWESFFLNEGFTVFLERRIVKALYGEPFKELHSLIGWEDLKGSVSLMGHDHPYTCLYVRLGPGDPDDAFSSVPYEKGYAFLCYLESIIGGEKPMNEYLKAHCEQFKYTSITADDFKSFFLGYHKGKGVDQSKLDQIDWDAWYNNPGLPPYQPHIDASLAKEATSAAKWVCSCGSGHRTVAALGSDVSSSSSSSTPVLLEEDEKTQSLKAKDWVNPQVLVFLDALTDEQEQDLKNTTDRESTKAKWRDLLLRAEKLQNFSSSENSEVVFRWLTLSVRSGVTGLENKIEQFLSGMGRMKFVRPLFRDLFASKVYRQFGVDLFGKIGNNYHSICTKMVDRDREEALKVAAV